MPQEPRATIDAALLTMSRCTRLRSLSFDLTKLPIAGELGFVDHRRLQSLHLSGGPGTTASLLERISVPQLKDFTLRNKDPWNPASEPEPDSESSLVRFLGRLPLLESLSLTTGPFSLSSVQEILLHLPPSLQHFYSHAPKSPWYHADQTQTHNHGTISWPRL
ncbi:hypothetical protein FB45DRAFT_470428 [Roridomyces roridus]|uniref:Uncharacterized protein n=1 Tax=Roridomyces roridus TaxID=1738132 RepID=A0AAD7BYY1_9AGAR|nr:hypothetical protein FB45DRAFT_470428 [Roridomyces roridus]